MLAPVLSLHYLLSAVGQNQPGAPGQMRARISLKQRADREVSNTEERKALEMHKYVYMYTRGCVNTRKFFHPELSSSFRVHSIYLFAGNFPMRTASPNSPHTPAVPSSPGHRKPLSPSLSSHPIPPPLPHGPRRRARRLCLCAPRSGARPLPLSAAPGRRRPGGAEPAAPLRNGGAPSTYLGPRPERCREPRRRTKATPSGAPRAGLLFTVPRPPAFPFLPLHPVTKESAPSRRFLRPASAAAGRPLLFPRRTGRVPSIQARRPAGQGGQDRGARRHRPAPAPLLSAGSADRGDPRACCSPRRQEAAAGTPGAVVRLHGARLGAAPAGSCSAERPGPPSCPRQGSNVALTSLCFMYVA